MIWFQEEFQKDNTILILKGKYYPPGDHQNIIEILISIGDKEYLIFKHNPYMRYDENPPAEAVCTKYNSKMKKFSQFISDNNLEMILVKFDISH